MILHVNQEINLELVSSKHVQGIYNLAESNRVHLRNWLPWLDRMKDVTFIENFVRNTELAYAAKTEYSFVILKDDEVIGRVGLYNINHSNCSGEIGYWIGESHQGKGIVAQSCIQILEFAFQTLNMNRVEIKCAVLNMRSQSIPVQLGFKLEGTLRSAELLHSEFHDLYLYSLLKEEFLKR
jgi:ribosomal-protein-serine acetyltransferase